MPQKKREETSHPLPEKIHTSVGAEVHDEERGWIHLCHGYDLYNDLLDKYSWSEITFLHVKGELPSKKESEIFDFILRTVINPGPTNWATQAAMTAAATHTPVGNSLLAGLAVLQGRFQGALAVEKAMEMLGELVEVRETHDKVSHTDIQKKYPDLPGFDRDDSITDERINSVINKISNITDHGDHVQSALKFARERGLLLSKLGLFGAVLCDLGFTARQGHGLYLIAAAPGILAHLLEQMEGNWSTYPFGFPLEYVGPKDRELTDNQLCYKGQHE